MFVFEPIRLTATKGIFQGYFPCRVGQCCDEVQQNQVTQTAQVLVLKKAMDNPVHGGVGAAAGPAVGHEWRPRHSGQRDGVVRWPVSSVTGRSPRARNFCRVLLSSHCRCWSSLGICRFQELGSGRSTEDAIFLSRRTLKQRLLT